MSSAIVAKQWLLKGRVQGVGCRAQIAEAVLQLGHVSGWVRNLEDGRVEVMAKGPQWRLDSLDLWLHKHLRAPVQAQEILCQEKTPEEVDQTGFVIRR